MKDPKRKMKFRATFTIAVAVCMSIIVLNILTDATNGLIQNIPYGADTIAFLVMVLMYLVAASIGMAFSHYAVRAMYDFADREELYEKAKKESLSSSVYEVAISLRYIALAIIIYGFVAR